MKVVFVQPFIPKYSVSFFNELSDKSGFDIVVYADVKTDNQLNQIQENMRFTVKHLELKRIGPFFLRRGINSKIRTEVPDLVVFNSDPRDISQLLMMLKSSFNREVFLCWGMFHRIGKPIFYTNNYYRIVCKLSKYALTYSSIGRDSLIRLGINRTKIIEVGTAIDEREVLRHSEAVNEFELDKFKVDNNLVGKQIVLQVLRLSKIKKPELIVEAAEIVLEKSPDVVFVLIGGGELENEIKLLISRKGLSENFLVLGPIYDESKLALWFLSANVFVVPTCIGLSAHHAMCYGLPIITDNDVFQQASEFELIKDGFNGLIYNAGDIQSMANKVLLLLNDKNRCSVLSSNAKFTVREIFNIDNKVSNMINAIKLTKT